MKHPCIAAIIIAGKFSPLHKGACKPLATIGSRPILQHAVELLQSSGIDDIAIVAGSSCQGICHKVQTLPGKLLCNEPCGSIVFSSIKNGVQHLPKHAEAFFLLPVDASLVRPLTVRRLAGLFHQHAMNICYPVFMGRRGWPPLVPRRVAWIIDAAADPAELGKFLESHTYQSADVPVADEFIHCNLDTQADLARLRRRYRRYEIPTREECIALQQLCNVPAPLIEHCTTVARVAGLMTAALDKGGHHLDSALIQAASMLHHCRETSRNHFAAGAELIAQAGFGKTAAVIEQHLNISITPPDTIDESHLLYLADKLVLDTGIVSLDERLKTMLPHHRGTARQIAAQRLVLANVIQAKIEILTGIPISAMICSGNLSLEDGYRNIH